MGDVVPKATRLTTEESLFDYQQGQDLYIISKASSLLFNG